MANPFRILCIDGGGIRGVYPAQILKKIQDKFGINLHDKFDMFAGTSTGGIISAGLACNISIDEIVDLYINEGERIFKENPLVGYKGLFASKFDNTHLKKLLNTYFKDTVLGDVKKPLILPASNITTGGVHISTSMYHEDFLRDDELKVADAVLASASAPTYFDPCEVENNLLADGGLWANNPTLVAVLEAKNKLNIDFEDIQVFSIGTGLYIPEYEQNTSQMGLFTGWKGDKLLSFMLSLQSQSVETYLSRLLNEKQVLRLNFTSNIELTLDNVELVNNLLGRANTDFANNSVKIKQFLLNDNTNNMLKTFLEDKINLPTAIKGKIKKQKLI